MSTKWHNRLHELMHSKRMPASELARRIGVSEWLVRKWLKGTVDNPRGESLTRAAREFGVTEQWLRYGDGPAPQTAAELNNFVSMRLIDVLPLREVFDRYSGRVGEVADPMRTAEKLDLPGEFGPQAVAVRVDDDSMAPHIPRGAIVVCDPAEPPEPGRYVVAVVAATASAVVRRYRLPSTKKPHACVLLPSNPDYPEIHIESKKDGHVVGRVTWVMTKG